MDKKEITRIVENYYNFTYGTNYDQGSLESSILGAEILMKYLALKYLG